MTFKFLLFLYSEITSDSLVYSEYSFIFVWHADCTVIWSNFICPAFSLLPSKYTMSLYTQIIAFIWYLHMGFFTSGLPHILPFLQSLFLLLIDWWNSSFHSGASCSDICFLNCVIYRHLTSLVLDFHIFLIRF